MCFNALIIIVVVFDGNKLEHVMPLFQSGGVLHKLGETLL